MALTIDDFLIFTEYRNALNEFERLENENAPESEQEYHAKYCIAIENTIFENFAAGAWPPELSKQVRMKFDNDSEFRVMILKSVIDGVDAAINDMEKRIKQDAYPFRVNESD